MGILDSLAGGNLVGVRAPEFPAKGVGPWLNSEPLTMAGASDRVVIIDFWTYSCVNCLRTLPYIKKWHEKYSDKGLLIIGVHTPEFAFEKEPTNVERFIEENDIKYPVVLDNDYAIWNAWSNHYWPHKFIVDGAGVVRYDHSGEGAYAETEKVIQELLTERDPSLKFGETESEHEHINPPAGGGGGICYPMSPELYAGYGRGHIGNEEGYKPEKAHLYQAPEGKLETDRVYLTGKWLAKDEFVEAAEAGAGISIDFQGLEANAVIKDKDERPLKVAVELDGKPIAKEMAGSDVGVGEDKSELNITNPRMYRIFRTKTPGARHVLTLRPAQEGFRIFAYTFGGCDEDT